MADPRLTVIIVSYNTRDLTLAALRTLYAETHETDFGVTVLDNASTDGSADAIVDAFAQVNLIRSAENLGFARANNDVAEVTRSEWILLLNPDTEVLDGAVDKLMRFAEANPDYAIYGGRTVFADGRLNPGSVWGRITLWSAFCAAFGLSALFRNVAFFNTEGIGGWARDTVREVDIVQGSFFLVRRRHWEDLGGFDRRYFMYGEEADLCLRARARGARAIMTPEAEIIHLAGASSATRGGKQVLVSQGRAALIRDHWPGWKVPLGLAMMWLGAALRALGFALLARLQGRFAPRAEAAGEVWTRRSEWLRGYGQRKEAKQD
jgi:GT2 family glycosyltransferase